jgi:hypothetical protein
MKIRDFGTEFGKKYPSVYSDNNYIEVSNLIKDIKKNHTPNEDILIYDWGGGTGVLAQTIINALLEYKNLKIIVIDVDKNKFIKREKISYVCSDLKDFNKGKKANYSISRNVFHYNTEKENVKILKNIYKLTKEKYLAINIYFSRGLEDSWKFISKTLNDWFNVYRQYYPLKSQMDFIEKVGWEKDISKMLSNKKYINIYNYDVIKFHTVRFKLSKKQSEIYKKSSVKKIDRYYAYSILFKK